MKGFLQKDTSYADQSWRVGTTDGDNSGPTAEVYLEGGWLHIVTDPHEGHVMLEVEALPYLKRALTLLATSLKVRKAAKGADRGA